jgi:hypothetical protein
MAVPTDGMESSCYDKEGDETKKIDHENLYFPTSKNVKKRGRDGPHRTNITGHDGAAIWEVDRGSIVTTSWNTSHSQWSQRGPVLLERDTLLQ